DENVVLANSPSLPPSPVKSKRSTAMPCDVRPCAINRAALLSLPQVKQCANKATARIGPSGRSSSAASFSPSALAKSKRSAGMMVAPVVDGGPGASGKPNRRSTLSSLTHQLPQFGYDFHLCPP